MLRSIFLILLLLFSNIASAQDIPIRDEGSVVGRARELNCVGAGIACVVSGGAGTITVTGTAPAGSNLDIQFNNSGAFGGDDNVIRYQNASQIFLGLNDTLGSGIDFGAGGTTAFILNGAKNIYGGTNKDFGIWNDPLGDWALRINGDTNALEILGSTSFIGQQNNFSNTLSTNTADTKLAYLIKNVTETGLTTGDAIYNTLIEGNYGVGGVAAMGTLNNLTSSVVISGNGDASNEVSLFLGSMDVQIGTGYTQSAGPAGRYWGFDLNMFGPVDVQPHLLNGITQIMGNYYNGSPADSASGGVWLVTRPQSGLIDPGKSSATSYPLDVGLGIVGYSGASTTTSPSSAGFTTGIQIGGHGSGWMPNTEHSYIGTGIDISEYATRGIYVHSPQGTPTADIETTGKVVVGGNLTNSVLTASELVATDASKNLTSYTPAQATAFIAPTAVNYGSLLPNVSFANAQGQTGATGDLDIYTVPANKRAIAILHAYNASAGSITLYPEVKISGTYYKLQNALTFGAGAVPGSAITPTMVFEAGDIIAINTATNTGLNYFLEVVLFDNTSALKTSRLIGLSTGDNTIYTCPAGKTAALFNIPTNIFSSATDTGKNSITFLADGGGARNVYVNFVPSGGSAGAANKAYLTTSVSSGNVGGFNRLAWSLTPGDFVSVNVDTGAASQMAYVTILEM